MDTKAFKPNTQTEKNILNYYVNKYKDINLDVVVVTDDNAINFVLKNQKERIFKKSKFFFSGINNLALSNILDKNKFAGVFEKKNPMANLKLAKKLKKNLKTIYLIGDNTITSHKIIEDYKKEYRNQKGINFIYLDYSDMKSLKKGLYNYDKNSVLILMVFAAFHKNGKHIDTMLALEYIEKIYKNPIITHDSIYTDLPNTNIIGGDCVDSRASGKVVAIDVLKYFNGMPIKNIKFKYTEGNTLYLNEKNLNKFGIKTEDLNFKNAIIVNQNKSFLVAYKTWIEGFIFLLITAFISMFIFFKVQQNKMLNLSNKKIQELNNNLENKVLTQVEEIKKSTILFEKIFNSVKNGIAILDLDSNFLLVNSAYEKITGFSKNDFYKTSSLKLTTPRSKEKSKKILQIVQEKGFFYGYEKQHIIKNDSVIDVLIDFSLMPDKKSILMVTKDITVEKQLKKEKKRREELLLQQSRLAQMGEMISMIAHQWRQPLGSIGSAIISMKLQLKNKKIDFTKEADIKNYLELTDKRYNEIGEYVQFLSTTIDDFRDFFKPDKDKEPTAISLPIEKALKIVSSSMQNKKIKILTNYHTKDIINIYKNELMQVILNILKNSEDAFMDKKVSNKKIAISTKKDKNMYIITIEDNAGGVKPEILSNIFDPYFSTKGKKNGTGLGLYMSKIMIEEHNGGRLSVQNRNNGLEFKILFDEKSL
jgi:PAS domain S-box-containing protein